MSKNIIISVKQNKHKKHKKDDKDDDNNDDNDINGGMKIPIIPISAKFRKNNDKEESA